MLSQKWIVWGGLASYSLYMTHYLVIRMFVFYYSGIYAESWGKSLFVSVTVVVALIALFIFVMGVSYHYLEVPCNRMLRNLWKKFEKHLARTKPAPAGSTFDKSSELES